jgi:hypothetical protein
MSALAPAEIQVMECVFSKAGQRVSCREREAADGIDLTITHPDGTISVEHYPHRGAALRRQHELICAWKAQGWTELQPEQASGSTARR